MEVVVGGRWVIVVDVVRRGRVRRRRRTRRCEDEEGIDGGRGGGCECQVVGVCGYSFGCRAVKMLWVGVVMRMGVK